MTDTFNFGEALFSMECGFKVINERGDVYWMEDNEYYCHPASNPALTRQVLRFYSDICKPNHCWKYYE